MSEAPHYLTITDAAPLVAARQISSTDLVEGCLAAIEARNGEINAFICVLADGARRAAAWADAEIAAGRYHGPLHGIPISLKDIIDLRGIETTAASRVRAGCIAADNAPIVDRLRRAGAVVVGKCNLHEFAFGTTNEDSAFGPARHPLDITRSPGGSSGGSAAAVVAGMSMASIGTDTGGSIRIPSAICGLVGLKPSLGEIPTDGVVPLSRTLDHVGPLARSVSDAWIVYQALRGEPTTSALDETSRPPLEQMPLMALGGYFSAVLEPGVQKTYDEALARLRAAGAVITDTTIDDASLTPAAYLAIVLSEAAAYHGRTLDSRPQDYCPTVRLRLELGRYILAEDYVRAMEIRARLRLAVDAAFGDARALILPAVPIVAPVIGVGAVQIGGASESVRNITLRLTQLFNMTGHPAITIPCGASDGLPVGLQIVGRRDATDALLQTALACEAAVRLP